MALTPSEHIESGPQDIRIESVNITKPDEVEYWTRRFGVSEHDLRYAVAAAGESVGDVRDYLGVK